MSEPVYMLNVLWFKKDGGKETYAKYWANATKILAKAGATVSDMVSPELCIIGEWDADAIFIVKYPSMAVIEGLADSAEVEANKHLREEALEKSLLIKCGELDLKLP